LVSLGQQYLNDSGATRDMAAVLLAKLFSRADAQGPLLSRFIQWVVTQISDSNTNQFAVRIWCFVKCGEISVIISSTFLFRAVCS
jgi:hypothetical protein